MRLVRWHAEGGLRSGRLEGDHVVELVDPPQGLDQVLSALAAADGPRHRLEPSTLAAPFDPPKIIAIGLNYRDHAEEQDVPLPETPLIFAKFPTSVTGPYADIEQMPETTELDYEGEMGIVIGRRGRHIATDDALDHVAGYVVADDVSSRDAQFADQQWVRGKSFDTFAPFGPALVTTDECPDPGVLGIRTFVNGEERQSSNTKHLIFDVAGLVAYCSRYFTLEPGDLILSGTPAGVGFSMDPPRYLGPGDVVEVEIDGLGRIANTVVAAP